MPHPNDELPELGELLENHFEGGGQLTNGGLASLLNRIFNSIETDAAWPFQTNQDRCPWC